MIFNVHAGHAAVGQGAIGAVGVLNESVEDRKIKDDLITCLRSVGHTVYDCTVDAGTQNQVLSGIVKKCNAHTVDLDISIHFNSGRGDNAGDGKIGGSEVWVYPNGGADTYASAVCQALQGLGFTNRGVKTSRDLYYLAKTSAKAMLIEVCFVDDKDDANLYNSLGVSKIATAIGAAITGQTITPATVAPAAATTPVVQTATVQPKYAVATAKGWLPEVNGQEDYAGIEGQQIYKFMASGVGSYQVHCGGRWLPAISGYDKNNSATGWAGDGKNPIDAIYTDIGYMRVSTTSSSAYLDTVHNHNDYAGIYGKPIDKVQLWF